MIDLLSWAAASLTWLTITAILWINDEQKAFANERKAREEGHLR